MRFIDWKKRVRISLRHRLLKSLAATEELPLVLTIYLGLYDPSHVHVYRLDVDLQIIPKAQLIHAWDFSSKRRDRDRLDLGNLCTTLASSYAAPLFDIAVVRC